MLKLKLQYFGHFMQRVDSLEKTLMLGGIGGKEEKVTTEDKMVGYCCTPRDSKEYSPTLQFKISNLWLSAFFIVQLSHPYMTTGKTISLTRPTFIGKVMSLLFNMLSRLVIAFLPRSKHLLISWLQSPSAVILEPREIKSATVSPSICLDVMGPDAMISVF